MQQASWPVTVDTASVVNSNKLESYTLSKGGDEHSFTADCFHAGI